MGLVIILIFAAIVVYVLLEYTKFMDLSNSVKEAYAAMDVNLRNRWELMPTLIDLMRIHIKHEREIINGLKELTNKSYNSLTTLRKKEVEIELNNQLVKILNLAEEYPQLQLDRNFIELSRNLSKTEDQIIESKKTYNSLAKDMNKKVKQFPTNIIAKIFNFKEQVIFSEENTNNE